MTIEILDDREHRQAIPVTVADECPRAVAQPIEMERFADRIIGAARILDFHLEVGRDAHDVER